MATNPALGLGGFNGKQMKAITSFCRKDNALHLLHTPFMSGGKMYATDQFVCMVYDMSNVPDVAVPRDKVWSLPAETLEKPLVKDGFYLAAPHDGAPVWAKLKSDLDRMCEDNTDKLSSVVSQLNELFERDACGDYAAPLWVDPKLVAKVCAIADAFNLTTMKFENVPYGEGTYFLRVSFYGNDKLTLIIMPKRM